MSTELPPDDGSTRVLPLGSDEPPLQAVMVRLKAARAARAAPALVRVNRDMVNLSSGLLGWLM